jgi:hypothetical protein
MSCPLKYFEIINEITPKIYNFILEFWKYFEIVNEITPKIYNFILEFYNTKFYVVLLSVIKKNYWS